MNWKLSLTIATGAILNLPGAAQAISITGLTSTNELVLFDSATPNLVSAPIAITGLQRGESILGIDYRPATGALFGLGSSSRLYSIIAETGAATAIGDPFAPALSGTSFGFSFNPVPDRIRVVSNTGQNLRLNPITGAAIADSALAYAAGDPFFGFAPGVSAAAYTNQVAGTVASTTLYDIDPDRNNVAIQNPPNAGTLNTVGNIGLGIANPTSFDIDGMSGIAYASLTINGLAGQGLYTIDLLTGDSTLLGLIDANIEDIAVTAIPEPSTLALLGIGVLGLVGLRFRRRGLNQR